MKIETFPLEIKNSINFYDDIINVFGNGDYDTENPSKEDNRFSLELEIENPKGNKPLIVIMMNPSETFPKCKFPSKCNFPKCIKRESQIDQTVQDVIKIAYICGYNKLYVYNVFPLINSDSSIQYKEDEFNTEGIKNFLNKNNFDVLIAWGERIKKEDFQDILEYLKNRNLFVWDLTKKNKPRHPSRKSPDTNKKLKSFFQQQNPKLKPIKFDDSGNVIAC